MFHTEPLLRGDTGALGICRLRHRAGVVTMKGRRKQVAAKRRYSYRGNDSAPGGQEVRSGATEKRVSYHWS